MRVVLRKNWKTKTLMSCASAFVFAFENEKKVFSLFVTYCPGIDCFDWLGKFYVFMSLMNQRNQCRNM